jgi:glycosyltransferase involved in cell wall biosynthesis
MLEPCEFGIVIPARNEAGLIQRCLESVIRAVELARVHCRIVVVDDRSTDGTAEIAWRTLVGIPGASVISPGPANVGHARALGAGLLLAEVDRRPRWIVSTDADSCVPTDWLLRLAAHIGPDVAAVAGIVAIERAHPLKDTFSSVYQQGITPDGHSHVHGANLAVRADAYERVGGFAPLECGEDHDLWTRVRGAGFETLSDPHWVVTTSARLRSRTRMGFARDLRKLLQAHRQNPAPEPLASL